MDSVRGVSFVIEPDETGGDRRPHARADNDYGTDDALLRHPAGQIHVDGVDEREQDLKALRQRIRRRPAGIRSSSPGQSQNKHPAVVRSGSPRERLERAADEVNIGDFIRTLRSASTSLSSSGRDAVDRAETAHQLACALAHDPGILISMRRPARSIPRREQRVRLALSRMIAGRTSVLIAHRLPTIRRPTRSW